MKQDNQVVISIVVLAFIFFLITGFIIYSYNQVKSDRINDVLQAKQQINLVLGIHDEGSLVSSQLVLLHPDSGQGGMVDIPGNIGNISRSLGRMDRLDVVFNKDNPDVYIEELENYIGQEVPFYIFLSIDQLERLVDLLEGMQLFILEGHDSEMGNIIPSGSVLLDGRKAVEYLLFDLEDNRSSEMVLRQQRFIQQLFVTFTERNASVSHEFFVNEMHKHLNTNLDRDSLHTLMAYFKSFFGQKLQLQRIMGIERVVDNQILLFPHYEGKVMKQMISQLSESIEDVMNLDENEDIVTIEILNGTDRSGLARKTADIFDQLGFEIFRFDNAANNEYEKTIIIDRRLNQEFAVEVGKVIKTNNIVTQSDTDTNNSVDVTVILGKDFDGRYVVE